MKTQIKKLGLIIGLAAMILGSIPLAQAAVNKQINYQGKLTRPSDGQPVADGSYNVIFRIYDAASGGNCLWSARGTCISPTAKSVSTSGGVFTTVLGEAGDSSMNLDFTSGSYYLGVQIGVDAEMTPRRILTSVPQAINANGVNGDGFINLSGTALGSGICQGLLCLNPASSNATDTLLGIQNSTNPIFKVEADGKVGIGTNTPNKSLHIKTASGTNAEMDIQSGSNNYWAMYQDDTAGSLRFWNDSITGEKNALVLKNDGTIGIGTTSPQAKLHVSGGSILFDNANSIQAYRPGGTITNILALGSDDSLYVGKDQATMNFRTSNAVAMTINSNGTLNIGGGATNLTNGTSNMILYNTSGISAPSFTTRSAGTKIVLYPNVSGTLTDFAFGVESGSLWSSIAGAGNSFKWYAGTTQIMLLDSSGNLTANSFIYSSDQRLKENIVPLQNNTLEKINNIQPVQFTWKESGKEDIGFIAQNVEEYYPELVTTDPNTGMKGLKYGNMTAVLLKAIQEQQNQIDQLKQEVENLKK